MLLGLGPLTLFHVAVSLVAIVLGIPAAAAIIGGRLSARWNGPFLWTTLITTLSGFVIFAGFTPAFFTGVLSTLLLVAAFWALYAQRLSGHWRWVYVVAAMAAFYLNCFVLVVQSFLKIPALHDLAPTGSEPPFAIAQGAVLLAFIALTLVALRRFHPSAMFRTRLV